MNRPQIITLVGVLVVIAAIGLNYFVGNDDGQRANSEQATTGTGGQVETTEPTISDWGRRALAKLRSSPPTAQRQSPAEPQSQAEPQSPAAPGAPAQTQATNQPVTPVIPATPVAPSFDVVRISPEGDAVIAGRAPPLSKVIIRDGDAVIGEATADARGEWVFVPDKPLLSGNRQISLEATNEDGVIIPSESVVVLAVPQRGMDLAGNPSSEPVKPLVVQVPREGTGPSRVLQKPDATPAIQAAEPAAIASVPTPTLMEQVAKETAPSKAKDTAQVAGRVMHSAGDPAPTAEASKFDGEAKSDGETKKGSGVVLLRPNAPTPEMPQPALPAPTTLSAREDISRATDDRQAATIPAPQSTAPGPYSLTLETVDYDDLGKLSLSGKTDAGGTVQVYLNNDFIGRTLADEGGNWVMSPDRPVAPGIYALRVDQVTAGGAVLARVEIPFSRAQPLTNLPPGIYVVVQPGNSLWRIARQNYGKGVQYTTIYAANQDQITDPDLIFPGQVFALPTEAN
jgi:nucleoid-associated protein YgaU